PACEAFASTSRRSMSSRALSASKSVASAPRAWRRSSLSASPERRHRVEAIEAAPVSGEDARHLKSLTEIEPPRRLAGRHPLEQTRLRPILHVADRERAEAQCPVRPERRGVGVEIETLDAERRHGVD